MVGKQPEGTHKKSDVHLTELCLQPESSVACTEQLLEQSVLSAHSLRDHRTQEWNLGKFKGDCLQCSFDPNSPETIDTFSVPPIFSFVEDDHFRDKNTNHFRDKLL